MAIASYADLKSTVSAYLTLDSATEALLPTFIQLAEAELGRLLDSPEGETTATAMTTAGQRGIAVPVNYQRIVTALIDDDQVLKPRPIAELQSMHSEQTISTKPTDFAIADGELQLFPLPDAAYQVTIIYIAGLPALSDTSPSNWLLSAHPDAYLYATIYQTEVYLVNDERAAHAQSVLGGIINQINANGRRYRTPEPGQLRTDLHFMRRTFNINRG